VFTAIVVAFGLWWIKPFRSDQREERSEQEWRLVIPDEDHNRRTDDD
jgi:hypothetical protein